MLFIALMVASFFFLLWTSRCVHDTISDYTVTINTAVFVVIVIYRMRVHKNMNVPRLLSRPLLKLCMLMVFWVSVPCGS